jgi:hypothetical protein
MVIVQAYLAKRGLYLPSGFYLLVELRLCSNDGILIMQELGLVLLYYRFSSFKLVKLRLCSTSGVLVL